MAKPRAKAELHYHGCLLCGLRFGDTCGEAKTISGPCASCLMGRISTTLQGLEPRECCRTEVRTADRHDLKTYKLAGKGPWWLCTTCFRQFTFDPRISHV